MVLIEGLKRAGKDPTRERFTSAIESIHEMNAGLGAEVASQPQPVRPQGIRQRISDGGEEWTGRAADELVGALADRIRRVQPLRLWVRHFWPYLPEVGIFASALLPTPPPIQTRYRTKSCSRTPPFSQQFPAYSAQRTCIFVRYLRIERINWMVN